MNRDAALRWSSEQTLIIEFFRNGRGHLVVRARAGTGKTTTIIEAIRHARERRILLVAFNKSIAAELQARLKNPNALAKTLHSLGLTCILRSGWGQLVRGVKVEVNSDRGRDIATELLQAKGNDDLKPVVTAVAKLASLAKGAAPFANETELEELAAVYDICVDSSDEKILDKYTPAVVARLARRAMDRALVEDGSIDYDDMIYVPVVKKLMRPEFGLVVVDEAQDMNYAQLLLAQGVCLPQGRIIVVGDDRQAIYGFRGADAGSLDRLKTELKATELGLKYTRRCGKEIVKVAQGLVPDFNVFDDAPEGEVIQLAGSKLVETAGPGDFILSRTNAPLVAVCFALLRARKRAKVQGRDIGKTLCGIVNRLRGNTVAELKKDLGVWATRERGKAQGKRESVAEMIVARANDQEDMLEMFLDEVVGNGELRGAALKNAVCNVIQDLFDDADPSKAPFIVCSSVHKAKGLEANRVFMIQDTFYRGRDGQEEQNIEYVAITRAKHTLFCVPSLPEEWKVAGGKKREPEPTPAPEWMDQDDLDRMGEDEAEIAAIEGSQD